VRPLGSYAWAMSRSDQGAHPHRSPCVRVRWCLEPGTTEDDAARTAMAVVEDVLGHPQLAPDAPLAYKPAAQDGQIRSTVQASAPIGFREARERLSAIHFEGDAAGAIRALTSLGDEIRANSGKGASGRPRSRP